MHAAGFEEDYKQLLEMTVCDVTNIDCMLQRCSECPGYEPLINFLNEKFEDKNDEIIFKQWVSVDRTELVTQILSVSEYIQVLQKKLMDLTPHHFISHSQSFYLKMQKENLDNHTALILMDFAENCSFHIQDEAQGYHWTHQTCTVHPVVCYFKSPDNELSHLSICFLSEELQHDTAMVYLIQAKTIEILQSAILDLCSVEYFSDGCAAQYKNKKSFYNLCKHESDFGVQASWSFFGTSHGKSPCDGIGGTVKRATAMESLRRPLTNQIFTVEAMMRYCETHLSKIKFVHLKKEDIAKAQIKLQPRFNKATTIKGIRSFHFFKPLSPTRLGMKRVSIDEEFSLEVEVDRPSISSTLTITELKQNRFVCIVYENKWYIGVIEEIDHESSDIWANFMHPHGPSHSFHWPKQQDKCWVPLQHVLCLVDVPCLSSSRGFYLLSDASKKTIDTQWNNFNVKK